MYSVNTHLRFFHLPTLDLNELDLPLLLVLSGFGAEYCFEKEHGVKLHCIASDLLFAVLLIVKFGAYNRNSRDLGHIKSRRISFRQSYCVFFSLLGMVDRSYSIKILDSILL